MVAASRAQPLVRGSSQEGQASEVPDSDPHASHRAVNSETLAHRVDWILRIGELADKILSKVGFSDKSAPINREKRARNVSGDKYEYSCLHISEIMVAKC